MEIGYRMLMMQQVNLSRELVNFDGVCRPYIQISKYENYYKYI